MAMINILQECKFYFIFRDNSIILKDSQLPDFDIVQKCIKYNVVSDWFIEKEMNYLAIQLESDCPNPANCTDIPLRNYFHTIKNNSECEELTNLVTRAKGLLNFRSNTRYCKKCGGALKNDTNFTAKNCVQCNNIIFPQIEPAVIILVSKGEEILLARHKNRNDDIYSCIAGFVEIGETIENSVKRELLEETGIKVKNIKYVGSQSWPFPDQLMLAFKAEYESGDIKIQKEELLDAQWFKKDSLPNIPKPGSVAYNLINDNFN